MRITDLVVGYMVQVHCPLITKGPDTFTGRVAQIWTARNVVAIQPDDPEVPTFKDRDLDVDERGLEGCVFVGVHNIEKIL